MRYRTFLFNTLILTATALLLRGIGIFMTAYLSRKIGMEGVGLFHLIFTVYSMAATLATSGISMAVSRMVAEEGDRKGGRPVSAIMGRCLMLSVLFSMGAAGLLYTSAGFIGASLLADARTVLSLRIIAPSLPFLAVSSCFQGYFLAIRKAPQFASASLFEQIIRIVITIRILDMFIPRGLDYACAAVLLGSTSAEILACLYAFALYYRERRKRRSSEGVRGNTEGTMRRIFSIAAPIAASSYLRTGLRTSENLLIPSGLRKFGLSGELALTQYGVMTGMVMPVLSFPTALLISVSMLIVPEIARANADHQDIRVHSTAARVMHLTLLMSIFISGIYAVFSGDLCMAIYNNQTAGDVLRILAPLVPLMYLDHVVDGMLNGLNQQMKSLQYNSMDSVLRISLIILLIPLIGMNGYMIVLFISTIFNSTLSICRLLKVTKLRLPIADWIVKPILSAGLAGMMVTFAFRFMPFFSLPAGLLVSVKIILTGLLYLGLLHISRSITGEDIQWIRSLLKTSGKGENA